MYPIYYYRLQRFSKLVEITINAINFIQLCTIFFIDIFNNEMSKLKEGDLLPGFSLKDQNDHEVNSHSWLGEPVVIYFYPDDNTPICTAQACLFRNNYDEFQDLGVRVVGISHNNPKSHFKFASKHNLPFLLLSDKNDKIRKLFGVPKGFLGLTAGRVTYVFDREGKLNYIHNSFINAKEHVRAALDVLKKKL